MRSDIPSMKQARKVSRILRPFVVIYDRESDRMHTLASPLEGDQATLLPHTERLIVDLCTICCPTTYFSTFTKNWPL